MRLMLSIFSRNHYAPLSIILQGDMHTMSLIDEFAR